MTIQSDGRTLDNRTFQSEYAPFGIDSERLVGVKDYRTRVRRFPAGQTFITWRLFVCSAMARPRIPEIGFGTMRLTDPDEGADAVTSAIDVGYRHIDTAQKYENEDVVGDGIAQADVPRDDLFVATKIKETNLAHDDVLETAERSLERLGLETVDLLYVHWPAISGESDRYDPQETLSAFNELLDEGSVRYVGVANFSIELVEEAQEYLDATILTNQVEMHPLFQQNELVDYAQENDMYLVAYCPMMRGSIDEVPELAEIAAKHGATPGQVSLAWLMSKDNVVPIPRSGGPHISENYRATELDLDEEDISRIESIDREQRVVNPDKGPWNWN